MDFDLFNCAHLWALVVPGAPGAQGELCVPSSGQRDLQAEHSSPVGAMPSWPCQHRALHRGMFHLHRDS